MYSVDFLAYFGSEVMYHAKAFPYAANASWRYDAIRLRSGVRRSKRLTSSGHPTLGVSVGPQVTVVYVAEGVRVDVATGSLSNFENAWFHGSTRAGRTVAVVVSYH